MLGLDALGALEVGDRVGKLAFDHPLFVDTAAIVIRTFHPLGMAGDSLIA